MYGEKRKQRRIQACVFAAVALLLVASCDDDPTGPGDNNSDDLRLSSKALTITEIGDTASLSATVGDQSTRTPTLALHDEHRWLEESPVLDRAALDSGRIVAQAPGHAVVLASAFGKGPDTVHVSVSPSVPTVLTMQAPARVGDGDTITLRGYRLNEIAPSGISAGDAPITVFSADSATLRLGVATHVDATCAGGSAALTLALSGADARTDLTLSRKREGEVALGVGEWTRLSGPTHCLHLPAIPDAAYALVYMDADMIRRAETGPEGLWPEAHTFTVEDRSGTTATSTTSAPKTALALGTAATPHMEPLTDNLTIQADTFCFPEDCHWAFGRKTPWSPGEVFEAEAADGRTGPARVLGIWGQIVVAVFLEDSSEYLPDARVAYIDTAMTFMAEAGVPLLKTALGETHPITSRGSGQLILLLSKFPGPFPGITAAMTTVDNTGVLAEIHIDLAYLHSSNKALEIFAHEIAHTWQRQYLTDTRSSDQNHGSGHNWATEGGATFLATEVVRHRLGIGLLDNWEWYPWVHDRKTPFYPYAEEVSGAHGYFLRGYDDAASFIRDQVTRLVAAGTPYETAIATLSRGVIEGWYGIDRLGVERTGLTHRMRELANPAWHAEEAVLVWTASQALDELIESDLFTNRSYMHVASVDDAYFPQGGGTTAAWHTAGWLVAGKGAQYLRKGPYEGATFLGLLDRGMLSNFLYLVDDNIGGTYHLSAEGKHSEWMLVRYR